MDIGQLSLFSSASVAFARNITTALENKFRQVERQINGIDPTLPPDDQLDQEITIMTEFLRTAHFTRTSHPGLASDPRSLSAIQDEVAQTGLSPAQCNRVTTIIASFRGGPDMIPY